MNAYILYVFCQEEAALGRDCLGTGICGMEMDERMPAAMIVQGVGFHRDHKLSFLIQAMREQIMDDLEFGTCFIPSEWMHTQRVNAHLLNSKNVLEKCVEPRI